jgi:hypothetical protein
MSEFVFRIDISPEERNKGGLQRIRPEEDGAGGRI